MNTKEIFELGELFHETQLHNVFPDGKTFPDCIPLKNLDHIREQYEAEKNTTGFDLKTFVLQYFQPPQETAAAYESDAHLAVEKHIENLWTVLQRKTTGDESLPGDSLIRLPKPYIVPGGRFREVYYWDSYFTMLGLQASQRADIIRDMIDNFAFLINTLGYIPNGNRTYYKGRSQPPFFSLMVQLLAEIDGPAVLANFLPALEKEYAFWMTGSTELNEEQTSGHRVMRMPDGSVLNRYWDESDTPRPESYKEDVELAEHAYDKKAVYRHIRAAAESGWDFSSRWFKNENDFSSIHTTDIVPVDLNCLLFNAEQTLAVAFDMTGNKPASAKYKTAAVKRKAAIKQYCWNPEAGFYFDFDAAAGEQKTSFTLAAVFPLYFGLATLEEAENVATMLHSRFLKNGGLSTTLTTTGQQWDAPNGWAPLQWMAIKGLSNYGMHSLAALIARQWIALNKKVYRSTGKLMEKYNVVDTALLAGGGEYPSQDGFGWTNGVLLRLMKTYR